GVCLWSWCKTSTEHSGRAVGDEAENPTARAVGIPLLQEGEEVNMLQTLGRRGADALADLGRDGWTGRACQGAVPVGAAPPVRRQRRAAGSMPSSADRARSPASVTFTARPEPILTHRPAARACPHGAAPAAPARWGRRSVRSRQARASGRL